MKKIETVNAVGHILCHDITRIVKDVVKDTPFRKGHVVKEEDIPWLAEQAYNDVCTGGNPRQTSIEEIIDIINGIIEI